MYTLYTVSLYIYNNTDLSQVYIYSAGIADLLMMSCSILHSRYQTAVYFSPNQPCICTD